MSAAQHERTAGAEEEAAKQHGHPADPSAAEKFLYCDAATPCWTSAQNSTDPHKAEMERHRELAAKHRAASKALRDAEATACAGVPDDDRVMGPFRHREDITSVTELQPPTDAEGNVRMDAPHGARAVFRAVPGLTKQWLQRIVNCHMARAAALGHSAPGMEYCPLMLKDVTAMVTDAGDGFAIEITSGDGAVAREVVRRMHAAASGSSAPRKEGRP